MTCPNCGSEVTKYTGYYREKKMIYRCEDCFDLQRPTKVSKHHPDYQAIMVDKKSGKPYAIDDKGRKYDLNETPYQYDNMGWKYAGKAKRRKYFT